MTHRPPVLAAVLVVAVGASLVGAVVPPRSLAPPPDALTAGASELRVVAPEAVAAGPRTPVTPPWAEAPRTSTAFVTGPGVQAPPPQLATTRELAGRERGWRRFEVQGAESQVPQRPRIALSEQVHEARVAVVNEDGTRRACDDWAFGRWVCGPDAWNYVGPTELSVRDRTQSCLWMHPLAGATLEVTWPDVPAGRVSGRTALSDIAADNEAAGAVRYSVHWGDEEVVDRAHPSARGWRRFSRVVGAQPDTLGDGMDGSGQGSGESPGATVADLTLRVWADDVAQRHFCVELDAHPARNR